MGGACTSIVFNNDQGLPVIASNLDYYNGDTLPKLTIYVKVMKNNQVFYESDTIFGYYGFTRGMKKNKFGFSTNSRFGKKKNNVEEFFDSIYNKNAGTTMQKIRLSVEKSESFEEFKTDIMNSFTLSPSYMIIAGTQKNEGCVIEKNSGITVNEITHLDDDRSVWYIVQTNNDRDLENYETNDPRRFGGEQLMNSLGQSVGLYDVFNGVLTKYPDFSVKSDMRTSSTSLADANADIFEIVCWIDK